MSGPILTKSTKKCPPLSYEKVHIAYCSREKERILKNPKSISKSESKYKYSKGETKLIIQENKISSDKSNLHYSASYLSHQNSNLNMSNLHNDFNFNNSQRTRPHSMAQSDMAVTKGQRFDMDENNNFSMSLNRRVDRKFNH